MEDVLYDSFFCCSRSDVENCQLLNKNLLKAIVKGTNELPLRRIDRVEMVRCLVTCAKTVLSWL